MCVTWILFTFGQPRSLLFDFSEFLSTPIAKFRASVHPSHFCPWFQDLNHIFAGGRSNYFPGMMTRRFACCQRQTVLSFRLSVKYTLSRGMGNAARNGLGSPVKTLSFLFSNSFPYNRKGNFIAAQSLWLRYCTVCCPMSSHTFTILCTQKLHADSSAVVLYSHYDLIPFLYLKWLI